MAIKQSEYKVTMAWTKPIITSLDPRSTLTTSPSTLMRNTVHFMVEYSTTRFERKSATLTLSPTKKLFFLWFKVLSFHACFSQVEFVSEAISKILSMYKGKQNTPTRWISLSNKKNSRWQIFLLQRGVGWTQSRRSDRQSIVHTPRLPSCTGRVLFFFFFFSIFYCSPSPASRLHRTYPHVWCFKLIFDL